MPAFRLAFDMSFYRGLPTLSGSNLTHQPSLRLYSRPQIAVSSGARSFQPGIPLKASSKLTPANQVMKWFWKRDIFLHIPAVAHTTSHCEML
jgi:hypothetical protein